MKYTRFMEIGKMKYARFRIRSQSVVNLVTSVVVFVCFLSNLDPSYKY